MASSILEQNKKFNSAASEVDDVWCNIEYGELFPPITASAYFDFMRQEMEFNAGMIAERKKTILDDYYNLFGRLKSDAWKGECEWRMMWTSDTRAKTYQIPIKDDAISSVYLGLCVGKPVKDDIIFELKSLLQNSAELCLISAHHHNHLAQEKS